MLTLPIIYSDKLETVDRVDLHRYVGKWYAIASYPNRIAPIALHTEVEYRLTNRGNLKVRKSFRTKGRLIQDIILHGTAYVQENTNNAKFKVQYLWPFSDATCIIDLADDYSYAVISNPSKSSLTILSRNSKMDSSTYSAIIDKVRNKGFNIDRLRKTPEFVKV
jgi:apolipoprotein D and lipocalin family protein